MERDHQRSDQENPSHISHVNAREDCSPRKAVVAGGGGGGGGDRLKRDEWSEGAVSSLLEAYEAKWVLRNRAKLKGQDWEDVARHVSSRSNSTKSPKTQTQCKNKIESMKKRYRSESTAAAAGDHASSWPLFSRLHHLLRGTGSAGGGGSGVSPPLPPPPPPPPSVQPSSPPAEPSKNLPLVLLESLTGPQPKPPLTIEAAQNSPHSNGPKQIAKEDTVHENEAKLSEEVSAGAKSPMAMDTDSSTPAQYGSKDNRSKLNCRMKMAMEKRKRRRRTSSGEDADTSIVESIRWLAEAVVKSEQARMEMMRELGRMRVEAEAKRGEMDLKRTEIIANTQLEIARLFAACAASGAKSVDSSLRIGRN